MSARADILAALRARATPRLVEHPGVEGPWQSFPDRVAVFRERLAAAGGSSVDLAGRASLRAAVDELARGLGTTAVVSLAPEVASTVRAVRDPRRLDGVGLAVLVAELGVAENGAVWVRDTGEAPRAIFSLPEHIAVVLSADSIVDQMHQAYEHLHFAGPGFGCFLSGPSKTADIEQSLVIGAHGARSVTILLISVSDGGFDTKTG